LREEDAPRERGQVTTLLSYELISDPLKITRVTDPFGRFATFDYTSAGRLMRITDVVGMPSSFGYGRALAAGASVVSIPQGSTTIPDTLRQFEPLPYPY